MSERCGACGATRSVAARFCEQCGARLPVVPAAIPPAGARKRVTVLFSDLEGSTALVSRLDPETMRAVLDRYFAAMRVVIERHGGTEEKYIGDAIMAVFGVPVVHEDDALRAVRAAWEMRSLQAELNEELDRRFGVHLRTRTGIQTGEVVARAPVDGQGFVSGDTVNIAARLEQAARAGDVLLGRETAALVRGAVALEAVAPLVAKGVSGPLTAFRLLGIRADHVKGGSAPTLVGRVTELATLEAAFERSMRDSACVAITLVGEPGMGKSRLVAELAGLVAPRARIAVGRCLSYGGGNAMWPLTDMLRAISGINEGDSGERARGKLAAVVEDDVVAAVLAASVGWIDPPPQPGEAEWALRRLIEHLAPAVFVVDDLQWAEPAFRDLLQAVFNGERSTPVLLVAIARPDLPREHAYGEIVSMEPIDNVVVAELAAQTLGAPVAVDVVKQVASAANGNPLFVIELVRLLAEERRLELAGGEWRRLGASRALNIPLTLDALLSARLDRLPAGERTVVNCASVIGEEFERRDVGELAGPTPVDRALEVLLREDLVTALGGSDAYRFTHLLFRDVAYRSMLKGERADLHERLAVYLERGAGDRIAEVQAIIGHHFEQAYRYRAELAPVGHHEVALARRAARLFMASARTAAMRLDESAAADLGSRASRLLTVEDPVRAGIDLDLMLIQRVLGNFADSAALAHDIGIRADAAGDQGLALRAEVEAALSELPWNVDEVMTRSEELVRSAVTTFTASGDADGLAAAWMLQAESDFIAGRFNSCVEATGNLRRHSSDFVFLAQVEQLEASALAFGSRPVAEVIVTLDAMRARSRDRPFVSSHTLSCVGVVRATSGDAGVARGLATEALEILTDQGPPMLIGNAWWAVGQIELMSGEPLAAERAFIAADGHFLVNGDQGLRASLHSDLAMALLDQGRASDAEQYCQSAQEFSETSDRLAELQWRAASARVLAYRGDGPAAEVLARQAVIRAEGIDATRETGSAHWALAAALAAQGQRKAAAAALDRARAIYERRGDVANASQCLEWSRQNRVCEPR